MNEPLEAVTGHPSDEPVRAMTTRVFLALAPPDDAKDELAQALRPAYDAYPRMRWNRIEDWHITLAFLGELPVAAVPPLMPPLAALAARQRPLRLALHGGGHFDERVLWTGVTGDLGGLHRLAIDVRALIRECGVSFPDRPLRPHLTLARSRRGDHAAPVEAAAGLATFTGRGWEAGRLHLVGSNIGRGPGPIHYRDIQSWDFRHGAGGAVEVSGD
ncbi:RNA 2',3'-cyclic phosphodiesterase [Streptomyces durocortorensis]|uniref:RNA 2',3'-cyclic phosphodiesterase n=1 Tax=Streptomyces durocortorensis TaxID=2811104 RepID=A0ABS2HP98_9ACTN|nr:RNA 2',3'-cyclic phosphodiesterase [Streptomyces durocortorensis]MBM7052914.1 RNA 2',3'-cyclic phosphodiesterase [Streptomyces durocortorensis]